MIQEMIRGHGYTTFIYSGDTRQDAREDVVTGLLRPQFLIVQIKAGGAGLNLQMYSRMYIMSPDWNPSNEFQAIGRSHRSGQTKSVKVTRMLLHWNDAYMKELEEVQKEIRKFDKQIETITHELCAMRTARTMQLKKIGSDDNALVSVLNVDKKIVSLQKKMRDLKVLKTATSSEHKMHTIDHRIFQLQKQKTDIQADILADKYLKQVHNYKTNGATAVKLTSSNYRDLLLG
jgi:hypothetical protein